MPITKSAKKTQRKDIYRTKVNRKTKDKLKLALDEAKKAPSKDSVSAGFSAIDRAAKKHLLHPNKAARLKSQLSKKLANPTLVTASKVVKAKPKSAKVKIAKAKAARTVNRKLSK